MLVRKSINVDTEETPLLAKWMQDNPRLWPLVVRDMLESLLASGDLPAKLRLKGVSVLGDDAAEADQAAPVEPRAAEAAVAVPAPDPVPLAAAAEAPVPDAGLAAAAARMPEPELDGQGRVDVEQSALPVAPEAKVEPQPEPVLEPVPEPQPEPVPEPQPEPVLEPVPELASAEPPAAAPVAQPVESEVPSDSVAGHVPPKPSAAAREAALAALRMNRF